MLSNVVNANNWNLIKRVTKILYFVLCVCVCVLMARINPFIAVSLKSKLLEGYCNACARLAQFSWCHRGGVCTRLGPAIAACSYIFRFVFEFGQWLWKHECSFILIRCGVSSFLRKNLWNHVTWMSYSVLLETKKKCLNRTEPRKRHRFSSAFRERDSRWN